MADVHFLRQVGRGVVDDHCLYLLGGTGLRRVGLIQRCGKIVIAKMNVDKTGAGNVDFIGDAVQGEVGDDFSGEVTGFAFQLFGGSKSPIGLKITKLRSRADRDIGGQLGGNTSGCHCQSDVVDQCVANIHVCSACVRTEDFSGSGGDCNRLLLQPLT